MKEHRTRSEGEGARSFAENLVDYEAQAEAIICCNENIRSMFLTLLWFGGLPQWKFGKQITSVISENPKIAKNFTALLKTYFRPMGPSKGPMT